MCGSTTFQSHGELNHEFIEGDINRWLFRDVIVYNDTCLNHFKDKYPIAHKLATKKWDYQGRGLGQEEHGIIRLVDPVPNVCHQGLGFGCPSYEVSSSIGTSRNNDNEEVVKQAYSDMDSYSTFGTSTLFDKSIFLIELPLDHPELIDWGQIVAHLDTFHNDVVLLQFLGANECAPYYHST